MHPILISRERLVLYLLAWLPIAGLLARVLRNGTGSWTEAVVLAFPMCFVYAFVCLSAGYICRAVPLRNDGIARVLLTLVAAAVVASGLWAAAGQAWAFAMESMLGFPEFGDRYTLQIGTLFVNGTLYYLLAVAVHYLLIALEQSRDAERRALEMQILARDAELKALRAQIDPHFLFNSLNSINALTMADPAGARRMCILLADFLRQSLVLGGQEKIPLSEELKLVDGFLDIEKVRFGARLTIERDVDPDCSGCFVPPLLIQPLAENAVRHGIAPLVEGGTLQIHVRRTGAGVEIEVRNPFDSEEKTPGGAGLGLKNVDGRLSRMFGSGARMDVSQNGGMFRVTLRLPCVRSEIPS